MACYLFLHLMHLLQLKQQSLGFLKIFKAKFKLKTNNVIINKDKNIEIKLKPLKISNNL